MDRYLVPLAKCDCLKKKEETPPPLLLQTRDVHDLAIEESRQGSKTHSLLAERLGKNHPSVSQFGSWDMCHASYSLIHSLLSFSTHAKQETPPSNSMAMFFEGHEEEDSIEEWDDEVGEDAKGEDVFSCDDEEEEEDEETEEDRDFIDDSVQEEETDVEDVEDIEEEKEPSSSSHPTKRRRVVVFQEEEEEE